MDGLCTKKTFPLKQLLFPFFFGFFLFLFFRLNQHYPVEYVKAELTKNETLWSVNETAQAVLNLLLVSLAIYWVRHD